MTCQFIYNMEHDSWKFVVAPDNFLEIFIIQEYFILVRFLRNFADRLPKHIRIVLIVLSRASVGILRGQRYAAGDARALTRPRFVCREGHTPCEAHIPNGCGVVRRRILALFIICLDFIAEILIYLKVLHLLKVPRKFVDKR